MNELGRILIADDEVGFAEVTADLLRDEGYACDCAVDAHDARRLLAGQRYDLLVADIKMPGNDDLEFIEMLPTLAAGLPVILVTGYPSLETAIKSTRLSVVGYMVKPTPIEDFLRLVREAVIRSQTMRMFEHAREQMQEVQQEMSALVAQAGLPLGSPSSGVDIFLHYAIRNILASVADLKNLAHSLSNSQPQAHACHIINCPRHAELCQAIAHAVTVLERTKGSFKSKELAALRHRLEELLAANHQPIGGSGSGA